MNSLNVFDPLEWGIKILNLFFGAADGLLYALISLVVLDYITGVCVAIHTKNTSSKIGAKGISKKVGVFVLISVSHIIDNFLLDSSNAVRSLTTTFYISNECISILENSTKLNLPLPEKLKSIVSSICKEN